MYIQYVGFDVAASSRIYKFQVIDEPREVREFSVTVPPQGFGSARLKLQDGPGICFALLKHQLQEETPESLAQPHLSVEQRDIEAYLRQHDKFSPPAANRKKSHQRGEHNEQPQQDSSSGDSDAPAVAEPRIPE